jgi:hypothetical protein
MASLQVAAFQVAAHIAISALAVALMFLFCS